MAPRGGMNLAIRGFAADLGKEPADTFQRDQHPDLRADLRPRQPAIQHQQLGWRAAGRETGRWGSTGRRPAGNANYAWLQHILHHLSPRGQAGVVLANGSMSSNQSNEGVKSDKSIGRGQHRGRGWWRCRRSCSLNTQIPACLWFLSRDKQ